jgi:BMFP domain-containing protein YqiC
MKFKKDTKAKLADLEERVEALENPETEQESDGSTQE